MMNVGCVMPYVSFNVEMDQSLRELMKSHRTLSNTVYYPAATPVDEIGERALKELKRALRKNFWRRQSIFHCKAVVAKDDPKTRTRKGTVLVMVKNHDFKRIVQTAHHCASCGWRTYASSAVQPGERFFCNEPACQAKRVQTVP